MAYDYFQVGKAGSQDTQGPYVGEQDNKARTRPQTVAPESADYFGGEVMI